MTEGRKFSWWRLGVLASALVCSAHAAGLPPSDGGPHPAAAPVMITIAGSPLTIPRLAVAPKLEDFLDMQPSPAVRGSMVEVGAMVQREPSDGAAPTQKTEVYLGYDKANLYVVFVCFEQDISQIRSHLTRREDAFDDDLVEIMLDTFNDQRRAYGFLSNAAGIQADGIWTEGRNVDANAGDTPNWDFSFDTLWYSRGKINSRGYVVWMAIPFKSLRFPRQPQQTWGVVLERTHRRNNEKDFWPAVSSRQQGRLGMEGKMSGVENLSPGHNLQFIPYVLASGYRALDTLDANNPHFTQKTFRGKPGLDSKVVVKDALVLDATVNPDFSQIESDQPQITVNQRFEVLFPELRPFFQENTTYFETPIPLLFTRRIADPEFGLRLSGKTGPYGIGILAADDRSPGEIVAPGDPDFRQRAQFVAARVSRDILNQSSIGLMFLDREFRNFYNRVGSVDSRFRLSRTWDLRAQAVTSVNREEDGSYSAGPSYEAILNRSGRQLNTTFTYDDVSPGFMAKSGYIPRVDLRNLIGEVNYQFRPEGKRLIAWGPAVRMSRVWDHRGNVLDDDDSLGLRLTFTRQSFVNLYPVDFHNERLRPVDYPVLTHNVEFPLRGGRLEVGSAPLKQLSFSAYYRRGAAINFDPISGTAPFLGWSDQGTFTITVRPGNRLQVDTLYLLERLRDDRTHASIFTNHIIRNKLNYQFTREFSLRLITQYNAVLSNANFSSLAPAKSFNADFLFTYLLHPGTAVYVGYNSDLANIDRRLLPYNGDLLRTNGFLNDSRQFFVKISYLLRY